MTPTRLSEITAIPQKDIDAERAKQDCIKYGTPTMGVDHSNHYKPIKELMHLPENVLIDREDWRKSNGM